MIDPGERRTFELQVPTEDASPVVSSSAEIVATVYWDRIAAGRSAEIARMFERRREECDALLYWLTEIRGIAKGRSPRAALDALRDRLSEASLVSGRQSTTVALALRANVERAIAADGANGSRATESLDGILRVLEAQQRLAVVHSEPARAR